jgi:hypothetical protein
MSGPTTARFLLTARGGPRMATMLPRQGGASASALFTTSARRAGVMETIKQKAQSVNRGLGDKVVEGIDAGGKLTQ